MPTHFRMEYWRDGNWWVGRLTEVPGVFSQGATMEELEENIREAYVLMRDEALGETILFPVEAKAPHLE